MMSQMFQHLSRCLSAASHHLLVSVPRKTRGTLNWYSLPWSVPAVEGQEHRMSQDVSVHHDLEV